MALTVFLPLALFIGLVFLKRRLPGEPSKFMGWPLVGVWLLGGPFIVIGASFSGGGFVGPDGFIGGLRMMFITLVPIFTIPMATYDGSLGALYIVSVVALLIWVWTYVANKKRRKIA